MKWMMSILAAAVMTTWTGVAAQSGSSMSQDKKMDGSAKMAGMDATYTGCIEAAGAGKDNGAMAKEPAAFTVKSLRTVSGSCS